MRRQAYLICASSLFLWCALPLAEAQPARWTILSKSLEPTLGDSLLSVTADSLLVSVSGRQVWIPLNNVYLIRHVLKRHDARHTLGGAIAGAAIGAGILFARKGNGSYLIDDPDFRGIATYALPITGMLGGIAAVGLLSGDDQEEYDFSGMEKDDVRWQLEDLIAEEWSHTIDRFPP